jgi:ferritin-like metal-binding protein YciE
MSESKTLRELFVDELRDAYDAEKQVIKSLRKMARAAQHPDLSAAFTLHIEETTGQVAILEEVFAMIELKPRGKHCPGIAGIIEESGEAIEEMEKSAVRDAALVGGGKRAEHYEIAAYTTMIAMAKAMGMREATGKLQEILAQEIATDKKLDGLAKILLKTASAESEEEDDEE